MVLILHEVNQRVREEVMRRRLLEEDKEAAEAFALESADVEQDARDEDPTAPLEVPKLRLLTQIGVAKDKVEKSIKDCDERLASTSKGLLEPSTGDATKKTA